MTHTHTRSSAVGQVCEGLTHISVSAPVHLERKHGAAHRLSGRPIRSGQRAG